MKQYKTKRLSNWLNSTRAQVVRISDNKEMLSDYVQLSVAIQYTADMNNKTKMGLYLLEKASNQ